MKTKTEHTTFLLTSKQLSIPRDRVYTAMSELGISAKLIRLCRITLSNSCSSVKVEKELAEPFDTVRRFRQGDPLSCDLFNFLLESVLRKTGVHCNGTIFYKSVQLLAYAEDIDIIGRTMRDVTAAFSAIERQSAKMGLAVNEGKTKYMLTMSGSCLVWSLRSRLIAIISMLSRSLYTLAPPLTQTTTSA